MTDDTPRRSNCPISYALDIFGDRWTLLVLRDLLLKGRHRFKEMQGAEEGIATNILSDRLRRLEARGLISRHKDPEDRRQVLYRPTELAVALLPMLLEMVVWSARNDGRSAVPPSFVARYDADREAVLAELTAAARQLVG